MSALPLLPNTNLPESNSSQPRRRRTAVVAKANWAVQQRSPRRQIAAELPHAELARILNNKGIRLSGFFDDDAKILQTIFDERYEEECKHFENLLQIRFKEMEQQQQSAALLRARRLERMEADRIGIKYPEFSTWIENLHSGKCEKSATFRRRRPAFALVVIKKLPETSKLVSLELSSCSLGDFFFAKPLHKMLSVNQSLKRLCLHGNNLGAQTLRGIAAALANNFTLETLDLSYNPLTGIPPGVTLGKPPTKPNPDERERYDWESDSDGEYNDDSVDLTEPDEDVTGIHAFANMLRRQNRAGAGLRCVDFRNCGFYSQARRELALGLEGNNLLVEIQLDQLPRCGNSPMIRNKLRDNVAQYRLELRAQQEIALKKKHLQMIEDEKQAKEDKAFEESVQARTRYRERLDMRRQVVMDQFFAAAKEEEERRILEQQKKSKKKKKKGKKRKGRRRKRKKKR